jgi:hypothetical protein
VHKDFAEYHGTMLCRVVHDSTSPVSVRLFATASNASYVINDKIGIFVKYSSNRMSPWGFSFGVSHHEEIERLHAQLPSIFITLICGSDGIACLSYPEFRQVIDMNHVGTESIRVSRKPREMYSVTGTDGKLRFKIGNNDFPRKLFQAE